MDPVLEPDRTGGRSATEGRVSPTRAVLGIVLAAVLFGGASLVYSALSVAHYTVSAKVLVQPDATLVDPSPALTSLDQNNIYLQAQVAAVQSLPGPAGAGISVTQLGLTNVLEITADATTARAAVTAANQVLESYLTQRRRYVEAYAATTVRAIDQQLLSDTTALSALKNSAPDTTAQRSALSSDYSRLLSLKHQVALTASSAQPTTVLQRARLADATVTSNKARNAVLAALVGALVAVALIGLRTRLRPRVRTRSRNRGRARRRAGRRSANHSRTAIPDR